MKNSQVTKFLILFVFVFLCSCDLFKSMCEAEKPPKQSTTLQQIVNDTNAGETIDLEKYSNEYDITDYNAEISKNLTIKNGSFQNTTLKIKAEVKLERVQELSVETSANLTIRDSKLNNLLLGTNAESRSTNSGNTNFDLKVIVKNCEIAEKIKINSKAKLNIAGEKTKIAKIVVAVAAEVCKILCTTEVDTKKIENVITDENGEKPEEIKITQAYKITYHSNCDELEDIEDFFSPDDGTISLPTDIFKRNDYIFAGWYEDNNQAVEDSINVSDKTADIHVYAKWKIKSSVYSYTLNLNDISKAWNGTPNNPNFSIVLLTDDQVKASVNKFNFSSNAYQFYSYRDMGVGNPIKPGNYAVYGKEKINDEYKYYSGVAATVTNETLEVFVDMSQIIKTELKFFNSDTESEQNLVTENMSVDFTGYKPYVFALIDGEKDPDNYVMTNETWYADLMSMKEGATFPTNLQQSAPEEQENFEDQFTTTPISWKTESFPYGFKFTTEKGYNCTYISDAAVSTGEQYNKVYAELNGTAAAINTTSIDNATGDSLNDDSTKIYVDSGELVPAKMYTLTYDKKNGTVKLTDAAAGVKATSEVPQESDPDGNFPAGIYISGYLGSNWAADDNAAGALLMDVVDEANEVYAFTWAAPAATVTVTLKITMEDTNSTLYLKDVPVKTDGTSVIDGSIYSWNSGIPVTIKNEDYSDITGGIFDAAMTATANADWALTNYVNGNKDVDLAEKFGMTGANDVLQLSIDAEKFVPYIRGQESVFSWNNAQGRLLAPTTGNTSSVTVTNISVSSTNHKTSYYVGEEFDLTELTIKVEKSDGTTETISVTSEMITDFDSSTIGTKTLTITYGSCTTTFNIEVKELTATADTVADTINSLSAGTYMLKVTGEITSTTITTIATAMNSNTEAKINLDLSDTTGLTEISNTDNYDLENNTFTSCNNLTSITIPNSVTTIGNYAFYECSNLTSIEIPDSVTTIGQCAFYNCFNLASINIPDKVESIGICTFTYCSNLKNVTIGSSVNSIGGSAFSGCSRLTTFEVATNNQYYSSLENEKILYSKDQKTLIAYPSAEGDFTIPNSVTSIADGAFQYCSNLTNVTIPDSMESIGSGAFSDCSSLTSVKIPDNVIEIKANAFISCVALNSVIIGNGVTSIGDQAFQYCSNLTDVTIPGNVTSIGYDAFYNCSSLTSVTFGSDSDDWYCTSYSDFTGGQTISVTNTTENVTYLTNTHSKYYWYKPTELVATADNVESTIASLSAGAYTLKVSGVTNDTIITIAYAMNRNPNAKINLDLSEANGATTIDIKTFYECSSLTRITIPNSVTFIGDSAFSWCTNLTNVTISDSVTTIGDNAFSSCLKLTNVTIPDSVISIGSYAFSDCSSLTNITIGRGVTSIGDGALFGGCSSLAKFEIDANNPNYSTDGTILFNKDKTELIAYPSATGDITIPDSVTSIGQEAFFRCSGLTNITIGNNVTTIGDFAFYNCSSLTNVTIPGNVTTIGGYVFNNCSNLTNVTINNGVTTIGQQAFHNCSSLKSITIPDSVESIESFSFVGCNNLTTFEVGTNNSNFSSSNDKHILFNKDKTELIAYPSATGDITTILDSDSVTTIKSGAFEACSGLTSLTIPDSVTTIEYRAIPDCINLKTVIIGSGVKNIYNNVFEGCSNLEDVTFRDTNNWYYTSNSNFTSGEEIVVTDTAQNATKLKENDKYWYKESSTGGTAN